MTLPEAQFLTTPRGERLAYRHWPGGVAPKATVVLVHGLGEHVGRYDAVARRFNAWGLDVWGHDHGGHGQSDGPRGGLRHDTQLLDDLALILDRVRAQGDAQRPLVLLGHSLGGLVAARLVSLALRPVDALVLSSPALDAGLSAVQRALVAVLPRLVPDLRVGNGLDARWISHDLAQVAAYRADPLVHDRISARLARFIATQGPATVACAPQWSVPTLVMYAGADRLVAPAGSEAFARRAPPAVVAAQAFPGLFHELFNESDPEPVYAVLHRWLQDRGWVQG